MGSQLHDHSKSLASKVREYGQDRGTEKAEGHLQEASLHLGCPASISYLQQLPMTKMPEPGWSIARTTS